MQRGQFLRVARHVAAEALGTSQRIGNLILTNSDGQLREPQLRHLWALECDRVGQYYSFEAPTVYAYSFSGKPDHYTPARHDLVLYEVSIPLKKSAKSKKAAADSGQLKGPERLTKALVELKHGLSLSDVKNDMVKLIRETDQEGVTGAAFMMVAETATSKAIENAYSQLTAVAVAALEDAKNLSEKQRQRLGQSAAWFEFLALVRSGKNQGLYRTSEDLNLTHVLDPRQAVSSVPVPVTVS